ncbi:MAG: hypothetical protein ACLFTB_05215 [Desulfovibrionales bacterium]
MTIWKRVSAALIFLLLTAGSGLAEQVTVILPLDEDQDTIQARAMALEQGFAKAAVQETMSILPGELPEERKTLLEEYFQPRTQELVLSYKEVDTQQTWTELQMVLEVRINRPLLKKMLQEIGIYYTTVEPWPYSLTMSGSGPGDFAILEDLQILSGLVVRDGADPALHLRKTESGTWRGELQVGSKLLTEHDQELKILWARLWQKFFSLPEVQTRVMHVAKLTVEGWADIKSVESFNSEISSWDRLVEEPRMLGISMDVSQISASWNLRTRDTEVLRQNLQERLGPQGVSFDLTMALGEAPDQQDDTLSGQ